ncbi:hypothetical protein CW731_05645 [Polaribacter sp. ALD11]|uniref:hypothetical protein n=1 Tax=Polaribacter sp. ALD11 TaxID=2058137 RepID=UPI000C3109F1|nr:hypothetical protein [Polaribacter sp. ALD11]AUC84806.1 hypothetical protein CW731_05645 [Polaribacter sp. ALD11]
MNLTKKGENLNNKILIVENSENENLRNEKYQIFHDKIYYLISRKIKFTENFSIIKETEFNKKKSEISELIKEFNIIIFNYGENIKHREIEHLFKVKIQEQEKWKSNKYSSYINLEKTKIIVNSKKFEDLENDDLNDLKFDLRGYIKTKEVVYYQFSCPKCNEFNLIILHNSEPKPNKCKHCTKSIFDSQGKIINNLLILKNNELKNYK